MTQILSFPDPSGRGGSPAPAGPPDPTRATLSELWSDATHAAATGFALAALTRPGPVLWVQDRLSRAEAGRPRAEALRRETGREVIHVHVSKVADALMAMEMGLGCPGLCAVLGEIWGEAPRLDFTATKRLALRAEANAVPCWLIRRGAEPGLSAARERWRIAPLPSERDPWDARAPGAPRWRPGAWVATRERRGQAHRLAFAAVAGDGSVVADARAEPGRAAR